jgi:hypothetical protein
MAVVKAREELEKEFGWWRYLTVGGEESRFKTYLDGKRVCRRFVDETSCQLVRTADRAE